MTVVCGKASESPVVTTTGASHDLVLKSCEQIVYRINVDLMQFKCWLCGYVQLLDTAAEVD